LQGIPTKHAECQEKKKTKNEKQGPAKQLSLFDVQDKARVWDINDSRAQRVHRFVMEMIAMDNQPFSLMEDFGFACLLHVPVPRYHFPSRKYFVEKLLPSAYDKVKTRVKTEIGRVSHFSFTTDAWSSSGGVCSLLSLTAHWLTKEFVKKSAALHVQPLEGSHTGEYLTRVYKKMLSGWEINQDQVHVVLRDKENTLQNHQHQCLLIEHFQMPVTFMTKKRNCLNPEEVEVLLFIRNNMNLMSLVTCVPFY